MISISTAGSAPQGRVDNIVPLIYNEDFRSFVSRSVDSKSDFQIPEELAIFVEKKTQKLCSGREVTVTPAKRLWIDRICTLNLFWGSSYVAAVRQAPNSREVRALCVWAWVEHKSIGM